ncbi:MAG: FG-GAP repeat domain-containing protein [Sandaracinaceae bacterium]
MGARAAGLLGLVALVASCDRPTELNVTEIRAVAAFDDTADYGVLEILRGSCESPGELLERRHFAATSTAMPSEEIRLPTGDTCVRVYAIRDTASGRPFTCSVLGAGERSVVSGEYAEPTLDVVVEGFSDFAGPGLSSPRAIATAQHAPRLCPPAVLRPFEGARVAPMRPIPIAASRAEGSVTYCARLESTQGPSFDVEAEIEVADGEVALGEWREPIPSDVTSLRMTIRTCPGACPSSRDELSGDGIHCTTFSAPRELVRGPWGDLNGDVSEDFAIGLAAGRLDVFVSGPAEVADDTYTICGAPYHLVRLSENLTSGVCPQSAFGGDILYGAGAAMIDVEGDTRSELIATALNCAGAGSPSGETRVGGAAIVYASDMWGASSPAPEYSYIFNGHTAPDSFEAYGLDVEGVYTGGVRATHLATLGGELFGVFFRHRVVTVEIDPATSRLSEDRTDGGRDLGGFISGHGDLDGDGLADLPYDLLARLVNGLGEADGPYRDRAYDGGGRHSVFLGDSNGNGRDELLITRERPNAACELPLSVIELPAEDELVASGTVSSIGTLERDLPLLTTVDCVGLRATAAIEGREPRLECQDGRGCEMSTECPACGLPFWGETMYATAFAHPGELAAGRRVAYAARGGIYVADLDVAPVALLTSQAASSCLGTILRGTYDLDGDGRSELVVLDPGQVNGASGPREGTLFVACGSDPSGALVAVENAAGTVYAPAEGVMAPCVANWAMAP